jgi:cellulose synthase (UDP-forming)
MFFTSVYETHLLNKARVIEAKAPGKLEKILLRALILLAVVSLVGFAIWFFDKDRVGYLPLFILLSISLTYKFIRVMYEWYHYWSMGVTPKPIPTKVWTVDMLTTAMPGEPFDMIESTLLAMKRVRYPHKTYLCDEGNDPLLIELCRRLDVIHVTRTLKVDAKAGNINNALQQATGEICVIMDPDHEPMPQFLDEVIPYFENPEIGYVQVVQAYKNADESFVARGAAQQTYMFYGPMMMGMNSYGTAQAIGANCTFRREALDSIGGHAPGLSEDMHTAMQLHAKGWKSVYVPKILTRGLVPATIAAYYKQQLKWARGTFDLLVHVYPRLVKNFSWRQMLHYFLLPLHYAFGIIALVDISIPVVALLTHEVPVLIEPQEFLLASTPYIVLTLLTRQYAQRWLLEKHERGFHLTGGILLFGTWWVFLLGFVYTLLGVKVPYIPTPKNDENRNNWQLSLPNMGICLLCLGAIIYGLSLDWNPYSLLMAGFTLVNVTLLGAVVLAGQQLWLKSIRRQVRNFSVLNLLADARLWVRDTVLPKTYKLFRHGAPVMAVLVLALCAGAFLLSSVSKLDKIRQYEEPLHKKAGGFYVGMHLPAIQENNSLTPLAHFEKAFGTDLNVVSVYQNWGPASLANFPGTLMREILQKGAIPLITWEPRVGSFPEIPGSPELLKEKKALAAIADGKFDDYLKAYAKKLQALNHPVFLRFAPEPDNLANPWSATGGNTPTEFILAWHHVVSTFVAEGVNNVTWVWNPGNAQTMGNYYPGEQFVDWVGITCLNYGTASVNGKWHTFQEIYTPFRNDLLKFNKPVMLAEFGSTSYGGNGQEWVKSYLPVIKNYFPEIKSVVFYNSNQDAGWLTAWRPTPATQFIDWTLQKPEALAGELKNYSREAFRFHGSSVAHKANNRSAAGKAAQNRKKYVTGQPGNYTLSVDGKPFYIKGVAYNPQHDWRDGNYPLTRKQLETDFKAIKEMGGNTIRRYSPGAYDKNILTIAEEQDLKVLYGFWFDPRYDYYNDSAQVKKYLDKVEETVLAFKDSPAVLGWSVGNETSSLLKKHYSQPYLNVNRKAYMQMVEVMAQRIHELDPSRPVFTSLEHSRQLPGELQSYRQMVPSVDVMGINSYYTQQISKLQGITAKNYPARPYLISEFGPSGYWDPEYSALDKNHMLVEESDNAKASLYTREWQEYVAKNKGYNVGGVAFCWRDRFEGSVTWFGITDYKGRKKPVYYAMQDVWQNTKAAKVPKVFIVGPSGYLLPDQAFEFTAVSDSKKMKNVEWQLYKDDYLQKAGSIERTDKPNKVKVTISETRGKYRLYAFMYDAEGNVTTASKAINL